MIVVYNPLILVEAALAGGLSFAPSKVVPNLSKNADTFVFIFFLALIDILYRYWRLKGKPAPTVGGSAPITPSGPPNDWGWLISLQGAHLLFVPGWVLGAMIGVFSAVS